MLDKLGELKDLWKLKGQMEEMKKRLDNMVIKVESPHHLVVLTVNGSMEVKEVVVLPQAKTVTEAELAEDIKAVINKAMRDAQMMAAQSMGSSFGIPND